MTAEHTSPSVPYGPRPARPPWRRRAWFRFRALARSERAWRLAGTLILAATASYSAYTGWQAQAAVERVVAAENRADDRRCDSRAQSRREVRDAIDVATEILANFAQLQPPDRDEIARRIREGVLEAFPPPDC